MSGSVNPAWHRLRNPGSVWIDDPDGSILFESPREVLTGRTAADLPAILKHADAQTASGRFVAGFFSYDSGSSESAWPLVWLGVYDSRVSAGPPPADLHVAVRGSGSQAGLSFSLRRVDAGGARERFVRSVNTIRSLIESGIVYQVNYTQRLRFEFAGDPLSLYLCLRQLQHGRYAAYVNTGDVQVLSLSPELFLSAKPSEAAAGKLLLETKPMKGTVSAGRGEHVLRTPKNLSENYMIVDLMRNDLGRICEPGSVKVTAAAEVTALSTALQMTSTVRGVLSGGSFFERVWPALFPAGSITGAPKRSAMKTIADLEEPRGIYTGAIGHAGGGHARFNVAIRTLALSAGRGEYGSGCGIVWESDPQEEYAEFELKSSFLIPAMDDFCLIETMRLEKRIKRLRQHLRRMRHSAREFAIPFPVSEIRQLLVDLKWKRPESGCRVRLTLGRHGARVETAELPRRAVVRLALADERIDSGDLYRRHKTTHRPAYDRGLQDAKAAGFDDALFLNERGEVVETAIRNILLRTTFGKWLTPPVSSGALPGVYLAELERRHPGKIIRTALFLEDLRQGRLFVTNSVRGLEPALLDFERTDSPHPRVGG